MSNVALHSHYTSSDCQPLPLAPSHKSRELSDQPPISWGSASCTTPLLTTRHFVRQRPYVDTCASPLCTPTSASAAPSASSSTPPWPLTPLVTTRSSTRRISTARAASPSCSPRHRSSLSSACPLRLLCRAPYSGAFKYVLRFVVLLYLFQPQTMLQPHASSIMDRLTKRNKRNANHPI